MAKSINLVGSNIKSVSVERDGDSAVITIVGNSIDSGGVETPTQNLVIPWKDLYVQDQNTGNNFLKHLSRAFNFYVADEDSETWIDA